MNATLILLCLASSSSVGQAQEVVLKAPQIEVTKDSGQDGKEFFYLLYNRVYMARAYPKPQNREDYGNSEKDLSRFATTYYHEKSPIGVALQKYNWFPGKENTYSADARMPASLVGMGADPLGRLVCLWAEPPIAVLGLEAGTLASYARPTQIMHFTERNPALVKLSLPDKKQPTYFHFVQDALNRGAALTIMEGEPRETIEKRGGERFYQVIAIETSKLPVRTLHKELLTKEAIQMLMSKLREDGILCFHTSNRYYDMVPLLASAAKELDYACLVGKDSGEKEGGRRDHFSSEWVMIARHQKHLAYLTAVPGVFERDLWSSPKPTSKKFIWSDKGEKSFRGVYRSDPDIDRLYDEVLRDVVDFLTEDVGIPRSQLQKLERPLVNLLREWSRSSAQRMNRGFPASGSLDK